MLSHDDLMYRPELVQPIGTLKGIRNKPTDIKINLNHLFRTSDNQNLLYVSLYKVYRQNGGKQNKDVFREFVQSKANEFAKNNDLNSYTSAEFQATGFNNYSECLKAINNAFIKECYKYFKWNNYNPVRTDVMVGPHDNRVLKPGYDLTADDHGTLDLWREQFTQLLSSQFRNNNRIPIYQASLHTRHFERGNEGLRNNDPDRASLETPIYGYDMNQIYKNLDKYKETSWYSM
jgi:hypothetical protein